MKDRINAGSPLELTAAAEQTLLVFTDGEVEAEQELATVSGILGDGTGTPLRFFSNRVHKLVLQAFMEEAHNPI